MVEIKEFQPLVYNKDKLDKLGIEFKDIICPPYDIISPQQHKSLLRKKYNFVHLELPKGGQKEKYKNAKKTLSVWRRNKILVKEEHASVYVYEHKFTYPENSNNEYKRIGLFCLIKADPDYETIIPHEQTKPKPLEERSLLINTINIQTSAPFFLVESKEFFEILCRLAKKKFLILDFKDETGNVHKLYRIPQGVAEVKKIKNVVKEKKLYIADGHHRYKVTCEYLNKTGKEFLFGYIASVEDEGLLILPTHRALPGKHIIEGLKKYFDFTDWDGKSQVEIVLYSSGEFKVLKLKHKQKFKEDNPYFVLNNVLKELEGEQITQHIFYHNEIKEVLSFADKYNGCAFIMPPVTKKEFVSILKKRLIFPPKTTYFYPKVYCGMLTYDFSE